MRNLFVLLIIVFCVNSINAQRLKKIKENNWSKGVVITVDGIKEGYVKVPRNIGVDFVSFKETENGKEEKISSLLVKEVRSLKNDGTYDILENLKVNGRHNKTQFDENFLTRNSKYLLRLEEGPINAYAVGGEIIISGYGYYRVNDDGSIAAIGIGSYNMGIITFSYLIKKEGEDYATLIYNTSWGKKKMKKMIELWLGDSDAVMQKLIDKKFLKTAKLDDFVRIYNADKGGK